ncbi:MAG: hypothetical protein LBP78_05730 [Acidaminococcales bacterium]|jgi:hypothetical protein|nr:hypothetical protein [Acidaminococcales bacterium]
MNNLMKDTSIEYLEKLIKTQEESAKNEDLKKYPIVYTHVEGYNKEKSLYELRIFMAIGKYIKDITIDAAFACNYAHNNKRLFYEAKGGEDPEEAVSRSLSAELYGGNEETICYMKI